MGRAHEGSIPSQLHYMLENYFPMVSSSLVRFSHSYKVLEMCQVLLYALYKQLDVIFMEALDSGVILILELSGFLVIKDPHPLPPSDPSRFPTFLLCLSPSRIPGIQPFTLASIELLLDSFSLGNSVLQD